MTSPTAHKSLPVSVLKGLTESLRAGGLAIFPTETVYGLGTSVFSAAGIQRIYGLKGRSGRKPLAILVHSLEAARPLVEEIPREAHLFAKHFMPGPITLIFKALPIGRMTMGGRDTIGVCIPDHPIALQILRAGGVPLATTSVNRSGKKPVTSGSAAKRLFGKRVDHLIDGGVCSVKTLSSVVDLSHYPFSVLRAGAIAKKDLEKVLLG